MLFCCVSPEVSVAHYRCFVYQLSLLGLPSGLTVAATKTSPAKNSMGSFHGCLRHLYINSELQDLRKGRTGGGGAGVVPGCVACQRSSCQHGSCLLSSAHPLGFVCQCQTGWVGERCERPDVHACHNHKCVYLGLVMRIFMHVIFFINFTAFHFILSAYVNLDKIESE